MNYSNTENLQPLIERLDKSYYDTIISLCASAQKYAQKLQELEVQNSTSQYVVLCNKLIEEIRLYISNKKEHLVPYVRSIYEKEKDGHDCKNCSGSSCSAQHEMHLNELSHSHRQLKEIISRVQMVALPLYSETMYPDVYRLLRNHMALIENTLTELFSIEETRLIPKIIESQKKINATDH
jgi:hypothetical protein